MRLGPDNLYTKEAGDEKYKCFDFKYSHGVYNSHKLQDVYLTTHIL